MAALVCVPPSASDSDIDSDMCVLVPVTRIFPPPSACDSDIDSDMRLASDLGSQDSLSECFGYQLASELDTDLPIIKTLVDRR